MQFNLFGRMNLKFAMGGHRGYERYFNNEYRRIATKAPLDRRAPTITVNVVKDLPPAVAGDIMRSVRCKGLFTFTYLVSNIDSQDVSVFFKTHPVDRIYINAIAVFLQAQVLEPIMYLKLLQNNVVLMHAGGVCDDSGGYLFPAYGGTGKTTFSIALLNSGYRLLGDDLLMVDVDRRVVYPYARPLHLFTYNINNLHGAKVPLKYKIAIYSKNVLRFFLEKGLRTEFLISTRVHADEIFAHEPFGDTVPYKGIFFLVKAGPATLVKKVKGSNLAELINDVMASADLNDSLYALLADNAAVERVMQLERMLIERLLRQFDEVTYVNTRKLDLLDVSRFAEDTLRTGLRSTNE